MPLLTELGSSRCRLYYKHRTPTGSLSERSIAASKCRDPGPTFNYARLVTKSPTNFNLSLAVWKVGIIDKLKFVGL
jgi:hypothetical protein